jgi:hypothetical protein
MFFPDFRTGLVPGSRCKAQKLADRDDGDRPRGDRNPVSVSGPLGSAVHDFFINGGAPSSIAMAPGPSQTVRLRERRPGGLVVERTRDRKEIPNGTQ